MEWKNICESGYEPDENVAFWPPQVAARQCLMTLILPPNSKTYSGKAFKIFGP